MTRRDRSTLLWIWACLGLLPLFLRSLWEPDEARYAEIPREMLALGDWLTPHLNFVAYFEKPPLQYWLSALSMKAFGVNAVAARLPLALASAITLLCAWRLAARLGARQPVWAAFMAVSTLLGFVCTQVLTLDPLFSAFQVGALVAAVEAVAARYEGRRALAWTLAAFAALALAVLTKGVAAPVLVGGGLLATLPWAWKDRRLRGALLGTLFHPLGWLLAVAIAAPWFVLVDRANPGHAKFFFIHEHFARFTSHVHSRQGSDNPVVDKLYFVGVLMVGLLPWLTAAWVGVRRGVAFLRAPGGPQAVAGPLLKWIVAAVMLAWIMPLAFYTASGSKLPFYVLQSVVPLAALACAFERDSEAWAALRRSGWELMALGLLFLGGAFTLKHPGGLPWLLALGLAFLGLGLWAQRGASAGLTGPRWMAALGAGLLVLTLAARAVGGTSKDAVTFARMAPADAQWISCGVFFQAIPFVSGQRVAVVDGTGELAFGRDRLPPAERDRWFQDDPHALLPMALRLRAEAPDRPVWAMIDREAWRDQSPEVRGAWDVVARRDGFMVARLR